MCRKCGSKRRSREQVMQSRMSAIARERQLLSGRGNDQLAFLGYDELSEEQLDNMKNKDFVFVRYNHRNRGMHNVYGGATRRHYGYRRSGDTFQVHVDDAKLQPDIFQIVVPDNSSREVHQVPKVNLAPPTAPPPMPPPPKPVKPVVAEEEAVVLEEPEQYVEDVEDVPEVSDDKEDIIAAAKTSQFIELAGIPGVTPTIEKTLKENGVVTYEKVMELGIDGLMELKYIGFVRAEYIYNHVKENYGPTIPPAF